MQPAPSSSQAPPLNEGTPQQNFSGRGLRIAILLLGIFIGQAVLYGPSLLGSKILLPLDLLALPGVYLPQTAETQQIIPHNVVLSDLMDWIEPLRRFDGREMRAGRLPLWNPHQFAGAPNTRENFSPFYVLAAAFESPKIVVWVQVIAALITGTGAYVFCRRTLSLGFLAATIASWCYPITAFFILWQGYPVEFSAIWLPWLLFAVDLAVRQSSALSIAALGAITALTLISGQLDVSLQVLMVSGLFAMWLWVGVSRSQRIARRSTLAAVAAVTMGWLLGFLLAAPDTLPLIAYTQTSERIAARHAGKEERPPIGWAALPQVVWPTVYGSTEHGSFPLFPSGQKYLQESSASAYAGMLALLLAAPLGWCAQRQRGPLLFFATLSFFSLGWTLNVPGVVELLRLPGLNTFSFNRLVFGTAFSTIIMMAMGLDALERGEVRRQKWFLFPAALLGALLLWCGLRTLVLPEPVTTHLAKLATVDKELLGQMIAKVGMRSQNDLEAAQDWFLHSNLNCATLCVVGILLWLWLWREKPWKPLALWGLGMLFVGELLWFGQGRSTQCDPALSFPPVPALEQAAQAIPGRFVGLPANLGTALGISCVEGYDGMNPARYMDLMRLAANPQSNKETVQWFTPKLDFMPPNTVKLSPIMDLLNVRYVVFRGTPSANVHPSFQSPGYWILTNPSVLERAFVPRRVETVVDPQERLSKLASPGFDPRKVAFIESAAAAGLPKDCQGAVQIVNEIPCRVTLSAQMETPGLVVLADLWDNGWQARIDGQPVVIERANHALRGVVVPAGSHALEFRYAPASLLWGWRAAGVGGAILVGLLAFAARNRKRSTCGPSGSSFY